MDLSTEHESVCPLPTSRATSVKQTKNINTKTTATLRVSAMPSMQSSTTIPLLSSTAEFDDQEFRRSTMRDITRQQCPPPLQRPARGSTLDLVIAKVRRTRPQQDLNGNHLGTGSSTKTSFSRKTSDLLKRTVSKVLQTSRKTTMAIPHSKGYLSSKNLNSSTDYDRARKFSDISGTSSSVTRRSTTSAAPSLGAGSTTSFSDSDTNFMIARKLGSEVSELSTPKATDAARYSRCRTTSYSGHQDESDYLLANNNQFQSSRTSSSTQRSSGNTSADCRRRRPRTSRKRSATPQSLRSPSRNPNSRNADPSVASIEISHQVMPCFKSSYQKRGAMWLLVNVKCVPSVKTTTVFNNLGCYGIMNNLRFDFQLPHGFELITYCGAVQREQMTTREGENIWSIGMCIGRSKKSGGSLGNKIASSVSSTTSMIDGFLHALRSEGEKPSKTAIQYRVTTLHSLLPSTHMVTVLKYRTLPQRIERYTSNQILKDAHKTINRITTTAEDDDSGLTILMADYQKWTRYGRDESVSRPGTGLSRSTINSLLPSPLSFSSKMRVEEPAQI